MTIDDYAAWAATFANVTVAPDTAKLSYLGLGLTAESGEVADHIKKLLRRGAVTVGTAGEEPGEDSGEGGLRAKPRGAAAVFAASPFGEH
jgi:hypothetical protein